MRKLIFTVIIALLYNSVSAQIKAKKSLDEVATIELAQKRDSIKQQVVSNYLETKRFMVSSDSVKVAKSAEKLVAALGKLKFKKLTLEEMNKATSTREKIKGLAGNIASTNSINSQRKFMMELSEEMWTIIDKVVPEKTVLYKQKCPMTGKVWISAEKVIQNPYYPKNMLTCGELEDSVISSIL